MKKSYFVALVKSNTRVYKCPTNPTDTIHPAGNNIGWFARKNTLCGFSWNAVEFPTKEAMLSAVNRSGAQLIDYMEIID